MNRAQLKTSQLFQLSAEAKEKISIGISWMCMALFVYAADAKISDHWRFLNGLIHVHLIGNYAEFISYAVPVIEIIVAFLLLIPNTRKVGLYSFILVMSSFTIYIAAAMIWEKTLPCHCGGAIEMLSWKQHIWFNLAFIVTALFALLIIKTQTILKNQKNEKF
jgi:hypothetical protein